MDSSFGINFTHDFNFLVLGSLYGWSTGIGRVSYPHVVDMDILHFSLIKEAIPNTPLEKSEVIRAVIVRTCKELKRENGMILRYDDNAAVVIDQEGNPKGTRIFGAIARELRQLNFTKIVSLAPEVL